MKKHQHFIPRTYLKYFKNSPDSELINAFNKENNVYKDIGLKDVCVEKNFYTLKHLKGEDSLVIEEYFDKEIERKFDKIYNLLITQKLRTVDIEQKLDILKVTLSMYFRTPKKLNEFISNTDKLIDEWLNDQDIQDVNFFGFKINLQGKTKKNIQNELREHLRPNYLSIQLQLFEDFVNFKINDGLIFQANKPFFVTDDLTVNNMTLSLKENVFLSFIKEYIEESKNVDQFHHVESSLAKSFNTDEYEVIEKKINEYYDFLRNNLSLLTIFHQMFYELEIDNHSSKSDLRKINLILFSQYFADPKFPIDDEDYYNILERITDDEASDYNDEIMLKIRYILNHTEKFNYRTYNLFQIFTIYYNFWADHFKLRNYFEDEFYANNLQVNLFHYCIIKSYKTIKYPQYKNSNSENINTIESFSHDFKLDERIYSLHSGFLEDLIKDQSHISLKLRQCIVLLRLCLDNKKNKLVSFYSKYFEGKKDLDVTILNNLIDEISLKYDIERVLLLPPRIFDLEIYLKSQITNEGDILIRKISSGEYQKNAVISSVIYHLKNLDSVNFRSSDLVNPESIYNFEDINIIFDEIELYFHPDFQRTFIKELISRLKDVEFTKIKSINFLFITHSPFILSDIPKVNVLFLKKGKPDFPMQEDTFGANIHTLLQHGFFLNAVPIGDFAKDKINEIFSRLHNGKITDEFGEDLLKSIMLVSEPFIKTQLLKHYNELNPDIKALKEQVDFLTKELLQIKKDNDKN